MRRFSFYFLWLFFSVIIPHSLLADCSCEQFIPCEKTYIQAQQLVVHEGSLFIQANDTYYLTSTVYSDEHGLFIKDYAHGCTEDEWWCYKCKKCNKYIYFLCPTCSSSQIGSD